MHNFEHSLEKIQALLESMESGNLPLVDALNQYKEGMTLIQACQQQLDAVEKEINLLMTDPMPARDDT